jgi:hypothetical protein
VLSVGEPDGTQLSLAFWTRPKTGCYATSVAAGSFISAYMRGAGMAYRLTTTEWHMDSPAPGALVTTATPPTAQVGRNRRADVGGKREALAAVSLPNVMELPGAPVDVVQAETSDLS